MKHRVVVALAAVVLGLAWQTAARAEAPRPATPEQIAGYLKKAGTAKDYAGADWVYVLDESDVFVENSGLATTESCEVFKILTDSGVRRHSVYRLGFDPATNRVTIRSIRIHRGDGATVDVDVAAAEVQPARQRSIFWGNQQFILQLPRLKIGDALEVRLSRVGYNIAYLADRGDAAPRTVLSAAGEPLRPPMPGHWYEVTEFPRSVPILHKRYSVHMPQDMPIQYEVYNGSLKSSLWFDDEHHVYTWQADDIPAIKREPHMVATSDCVTKVVLATVKDWETKSRWFFQANESQFEANDEIRAMVRQITAGLDDEEAKIAALNSWVADSCRYVGTSRGQHEGFTLHKGIETFRDRGGVCKDKAGMLVTMLRVLGHEAYPALTMAGSRVEAIPADQFNHTVTVIREPDGSFEILDPTWAPLSRELWSSREALQGLVYGTPEGQTLTLSPYFKPEDNRLLSRGTSVIRDDGTLTTTFDMEMDGYPCTYLRRTVARRRSTEQRGVFEDALNIAPTAQIEQLTFTDPYDYSSCSEVHMNVTAADAVVVGHGLRAFRLPLLSHPLSAFLYSDAFYSVAAKERKYGLRLRATRLVQLQETVDLPQGWRIEQLPDPVTIDSDTAALRFEATDSADKLSYEFTLTLKEHIVSPRGYQDLKKVLEAMKKLSDQWVACRVELEPSEHADAR